ncbi:MAG: ABC transporter permease [Lachnospiraceae bacterium]|nr:ABC transporter permease [Lachnospiraceae bacterium]
MNDKSVQRIFLIVPIAILSFILFCGIVVDKSLANGTDNLRKRIGAELIIVPDGAESEAKNIIIEGQRGTFYFDRTVYNTISSLDGVADATPQFFFKSLSQDCCSSEVEIVFFDPFTDFLIQPWINKEYNKKLTKDAVIAGSSINVSDNGTIKIFGREYIVAAQMAKTGTSLDSSVYFTFEAQETLLKDAEGKGAFVLDEQKSTSVISSVFINIEKGRKTEDIIKEIEAKSDIKTDIIYPKKLDEAMSSSLSEIYTALHVVIIISVVLIVIILFCINYYIMSDRKREIALYQMLGASRVKVRRILCKDTVITSIAGGFAGVIFGTVVAIPFGDYIGTKLNMPYLGPDVTGVLSYYAVVLIITVAVGIAGSLYPVLFVTNLEPYIALRREGD